MNKVKEYFESNFCELFERYDSYNSVDIHTSWINVYDFKNKKILDIGSGSGRDSLYLAQVGGRVLAVDFIDKMIESAKKKDFINSVEWLCDSLPALTKVKSNDFDFVLVSAVIMFLNQLEQKQSIQRIYDLLRVGGILIITSKKDIIDPIETPLFEDFIIFSHKLGFHVIEQLGGEDLGGRPIIWRVLILKKVT